MFKTPAIGMSGVFSLIPPFNISQEKVYKVEGHRTFSEIISSGEDPIALIYEPVGLTVDDYREDAALSGIVVLVLVNEEGDRVLVPNKYLVDYPNTSIVPHEWVVATTSLGVLPVGFDFQRLRDAIVESISDYTGVEASVYFVRKKTSTVVTQAEADQLATVRQAAIKYRETSYADKLALQQRVATLQQEVNDLIEIINQS